MKRTPAREQFLRDAARPGGIHAKDFYPLRVWALEHELVAPAEDPNWFFLTLSGKRLLLQWMGPTA